MTDSALGTHHPLPITHHSYRGIYTIPATPFNEDLSVDEESFRREIEFCCQCGAQGIVWPVAVLAISIEPKSDWIEESDL